MKIYIDRIPPDGLDLSEDIPAGALDLMTDDARLTLPVAVRVRAQLLGHELIVRGSLRTRAEFECSRCLRTFSADLARDDLFYEFEVESQDTIDLTDSVREDIILLFPMRPLCSEACQGLCPLCGELKADGRCRCEAPPVDERLKGLDGLRDKLKDG